MNRFKRYPRRGRAAAFLTAGAVALGALTVGAAAASASADSPPGGSVGWVPDGATLVFADEFDGTELDRSEWCTRYPWSGWVRSEPDLDEMDPECLNSVDHGSWTEVQGTMDTLAGNGEQETYVDVNSNGDQVHTVQDGYLSLHANYTRPDDDWYYYESGMIRSQTQLEPPTSDRATYVVSRTRWSDIKGTWPAFWLIEGYGEKTNGWPPEIDIFDSPINYDGDNPQNIKVGAIYGEGSDPAQGTPGWYDVHPNFETTWGNYIDPEGDSLRNQWLEIGIYWTEDSVCWYYDGARLGCQEYYWRNNDGAQANPATIVLNQAVGGPWAGRNGVDNAGLPATMDVDWVRAYEVPLDPSGDPSDDPSGDPEPPSGTAPVAWTSTSSTYDGSHVADNVADGDLGTAWRPAAGGWQTLDLELDGQHSVSAVQVDWGDTYAGTYEVYTRVGSGDWVSRGVVTGGDGGTDLVSFAAVPATAVRLYVKQDVPPDGYEVRELSALTE